MNEQQQQKGVVKFKISQCVKYHIRVKYTLFVEWSKFHTYSNVVKEIPTPETSLPT